MSRSSLVIGYILLAASQQNERCPASPYSPTVGIIGLVGKDLPGLQAIDQIIGGSHVVLLSGAEVETHRQAERVDYGVDFGAEAAARPAKSLGLRSPLFCRAPAAWA